ncbi:MAG TPA: hypothetical protein VM509_05060 [Planctomycetota bacterium]|nr:hypothetical protein [Planctomycetota bacterium]
MASHKLFIEMDIRECEVTSKDVIFLVYRKKGKFGELRLSRGAVVWRGRRDQIGRKLSWNRFDKLMEDSARRSERRQPGTRLSISKRSRSAR